MTKVEKKSEKVDLAFFSEPFDLEDDPYEPKFGGSPISIFPGCELPIPQCTNCKSNLIFILQLFNPVKGGKLFYVFACCNAECLNMDWKIYRTNCSLDLDDTTSSPQETGATSFTQSSLPGWDTTADWGTSDFGSITPTTKSNNKEKKNNNTKLTNNNNTKKVSDNSSTVNTTPQKKNNNNNKKPLNNTTTNTTPTSKLISEFASDFSSFTSDFGSTNSSWGQSNDNWGIPSTDTPFSLPTSTTNTTSSKPFDSTSTTSLNNISIDQKNPLTSNFASSSFNSTWGTENNDWGQNGIEDWGQNTNTDTSSSNTTTTTLPPSEASNTTNTTVPITKFVPKTENCGFPPHYMEWSEEPIAKPTPKRNTKQNYVESINEDFGKEEYESEDKYFKTFQKKMRLSPAHCLRVGGTPIWMREDKKITQKVPNCSVCGKLRNYEFQIMSPLIYFMKPINPKIELSFGVVTIYGCQDNCIDKRNSSHRFIEEFYIKQDD